MFGVGDTGADDRGTDLWFSSGLSASPVQGSSIENLVLDMVVCEVALDH